MCKWRSAGTIKYYRAVVYTDDASKTYFGTTLKLIGLGECSVRTVQTTSSGDLDRDDLTAQITGDIKVIGNKCLKRSIC